MPMGSLKKKVVDIVMKDRIDSHWKYRLNWRLAGLLERNLERDIWREPSFGQKISPTLTFNTILSMGEQFDWTSL